MKSVVATIWLLSISWSTMSIALLGLAACGPIPKKAAPATLTDGDFKSSGQFTANSDKKTQPRSAVQCDGKTTVPFDARIALGQTFTYRLQSLNSVGTVNTSTSQTTVTEVVSRISEQTPVENSFMVKIQTDRDAGLKNNCKVQFPQSGAPAQECTKSDDPQAFHREQKTVDPIAECNFTEDKVPATEILELGLFTLMDGRKVNAQRREVTVSGKVSCPNGVTNQDGLKIIVTITSAEIPNIDSVSDCNDEVTLFAKTSINMTQKKKQTADGEVLVQTLLSAKTRELTGFQSR